MGQSCPQERAERARADYVAAADMVCRTPEEQRARRLALELAVVRYAAAKRSIAKARGEA